MQFVLLGVVTAMLFITVPWAALLQLTTFGDPVAAAWAGPASFLFVFFWAGMLRTRPTVLALVTVLPAIAMLLVRAGQDGKWLSLGAVVAGPLLAALLRGWLLDDGSNVDR